VQEDQLYFWPHHRIRNTTNSSTFFSPQSFKKESSTSISEESGTFQHRYRINVFPGRKKGAQPQGLVLHQLHQLAPRRDEAFEGITDDVIAPEIES
jgi:hypothetical protein